MISQLNHPIYSDLKDRYRYEKYLYEFATLKIKGPRQTGHTTAALQLICHHPDAVLLAISNRRVRELQEVIRHWVLDKQVASEIASRILPIYSSDRLKQLASTRAQYPGGIIAIVNWDSSDQQRRLKIDTLIAATHVRALIEFQ
jgi:hypothetical protein